jgi:tetratricopeptide (TPR) repeat protein
MKKSYFIIFIFTFVLISCSESYLDVFPDDKITSENFWTSNEDANLALMGVYNVLRSNNVYGYGGGWDACTPNAFQWAHWEGKQQQIGSGEVHSGIGGVISGRWEYCYRGINRANYFLENIDNIVTLSDSEKKQMIGEVYFLRGVFYALLADTYGGVPIILNSLTTEEARSLSRSSLDDTWAQVHADYDEAISRLSISAPQKGRADLGATLGMKMRAYLYQNNYPKVLEYVEKIEALDKYSLFPSYYGLFQLENEGNNETVFALQFLDGPISQGSIFDRYWQPQNLKFGIDGSNSVAPIQDLVDAYETIDGSPIQSSGDDYNLAQFENRDPRLDFTILRPGAEFQGQKYPEEIKNHTGQRVGYAIRKYTIETQAIKQSESPLDYMILRYGDILMSKAEALIETGTDIDEAIRILNRFRTERVDVNITPLPLGMSQAEAREALRKERRIEFALEGIYWSDIKRWKIGPAIYPVEVRGPDGDLIHVKFANGYNLEKDNLIPIPDSERSLNPNLEQNPGY